MGKRFKNTATKNTVWFKRKLSGNFYLLAALTVTFSEGPKGALYSYKSEMKKSLEVIEKVSRDFSKTIKTLS
jgi:hypothetical protein